MASGSSIYRSLLAWVGVYLFLQPLLFEVPDLSRVQRPSWRELDQQYVVEQLPYRVEDGQFSRQPPWSDSGSGRMDARDFLSSEQHISRIELARDFLSSSNDVQPACVIYH